MANIRINSTMRKWNKKDTYIGMGSINFRNKLNAVQLFAVFAGIVIENMDSGLFRWVDRGS